ncbi:MAG TPA: c-type cytochrome [Hyphomicrobiales bacterium]|nr:c-type cytochrome [Hyphomicrobiales bacterium]
MPKALSILSGLALAAGLFTLPAAQAQQTTVLDGVYSRAQAQRGARTYRNICAECHEGGEPDADPLIGPDFVERWREAPLSFLHGFFSREMPGDEPGSLSDTVYLETLAYLLQANGYPAGSALEQDALDDILLVSEDGPRPLPANALVRVVGCLVGEGEDQRLEQASTPFRVRRADDTTPEELALSTAEPLAEQHYALRGSALGTHTHTAGTKVQVKGVWIPGGATTTLTVLSMSDTAQRCD